MSDYQPIIDVQPLEHSREQTTSAARTSSARSSSQSPSWNAASSRYRSTGAGATPPFGAPFAQDSSAAAASKSGSSVLGGIVRVVAGAGLILAGIPMLILPGPGLLTMTAGALLMASGTRRILG